MDTEKFVQNVKNFSALRGISATAACRDSGAGKDLINQIESRGSIPSVAKVQMLADYLGVTTSELLGETAKPATEISDGLSEAERGLIDLFRRLTPEQQDMVLRMVQAASDKQ